MYIYINDDFILYYIIYICFNIDSRKNNMYIYKYITYNLFIFYIIRLDEPFKRNCKTIRPDG